MPQYRVPTLRTQLESSAPRRRVVLVTNRAANSLEYLGLLQIFSEARFFLAHSGQEATAYQVEIVSRGTGTVYEENGLTISASRPYQSLRGPVDTLIFQAMDDDDECLRDERFISWVRKMGSRVRRIVSLCTGSFILAEAGLLDGRLATTHWAAAEDFRERYPAVRLDPQRIHTKDGNTYTSAGVSASTDLGLVLLEEDYGSELARRVAQAMVLYLRRPGNQAQFGAGTVPCKTGQDFESYICDHLEGDLRVETLANHFGLSMRTFNRAFRKQLGMPPGRFVEQRRVGRARQLLEETSEAVSQIARQSGYSSSNGLCLAFERHLGTTPRAYRQRFASASLDSQRISRGPG